MKITSSFCGKRSKHLKGKEGTNADEGIYFFSCDSEFCRLTEVIFMFQAPSDSALPLPVNVIVNETCPAFPRGR